jgi:ankyrin repeat protein
VQALLVGNADGDAGGRMPLMWAAGTGRLGIVRLLLGPVPM